MPSRKPRRFPSASCQPLEPRRLLSGYTLTVLADMDSTVGSDTQAPLVRDAQGNLFGNSALGGPFADGTIFELPVGQHTAAPLLTFDEGNTGIGQNQRGGITIDQSDTIYSAVSSDLSVNSIFKLPGGANFSSLHTFDPDTEGTSTTGDLLIHQPAITVNNVGIGVDIFGTTAQGGENNSGTIYELSDIANTISLNVLANFPSNSTDGPGANLVRDSAGDLFGTIVPGIHAPAGADSFLFEVTAGGVFLTLATFDGTNGNNPGRLAIDPNTGDIYGTTSVGGLNNDGTIFKYSSNTLTTLFNFDSAAANPAGLFLDSQGNLFGATDAGGANSNGALYELPAGGTSINILASFDAANTGTDSKGSLIADNNGNLFGVTATGGPNNDGAIFELSPPPPTQLQFAQQPQTNFTNQILQPVVVDVQDADGNLANFDSSTVTLSLASGTIGAGLVGVTSAQAVDGVATFNNLDVNAPGTYTLQTSDNALTPAVSDTFTINAPAPHLSFAVDPTTATAGIKITPPVVVDLANADFTLDTTAKPTPITLSTIDPVGKTHRFTAIAKQGVANFKNVLLKITGSYTLGAAAKNFLPATSSSFTVNPNTAQKITFLTAVATTADTPFTVQALLSDRFGNPATDDDSTADIELVGGSKSALLTGTASATVSDAIARFSNLSINLPFKHYRLKITDGKLHVISKPFAVS
jgi:uncharacterized repeat protein (TIGR03803 family)